MTPWEFALPGDPTPSVGGGLAPGDILTLGDGEVVLLDQTRLPGDVVYRHCVTWQEVAEAIRSLAVRGAPAIGIAGAMGVALAAQQADHDDPEAYLASVSTAAEALASTRPTAVNLAWAIGQQRTMLAGHPGPTEAMTAGLRLFAKRLHAAEVARCRAMAGHGKLLVHRGARILTHCNTGALATGGIGTALGVIRAAYADDPSVSVLVDETRPLLQGARLTAWELHEGGVPLTLITDNMVGHIMKTGSVGAVVVGADRIAANGDTANKIGTYQIAVLAREHAVPFYVAAPVSTFDLSISSGEQIPIEERSSEEVTHLRGVRIAPDVHAAHPAFDVTPARLISAIICERGVARAPFSESLRRLAESVAIATPG